MGFFKLTDREAVKRYPHKDGDWIDVREHLSKAEMNYLFRNTPDELLEAQFDTTRASQVAVLKQSPVLAEMLFKMLVVAWSIEDTEPTVENYLALDPDPANWIDGVLFGHVNSMQLSKDEQGKPSNSPRASRKGTRATA
jgi:hypothetical protein